MADQPSATIDTLLNEFISAGGLDSVLSGVRTAWAIPAALFDDRTQLYGMDVYVRMLRDEDVVAALDTRTLAACAEGVNVTPAIGVDKKNPRDPKLLYAQFVDRCLANSVGSLILLSHEILKFGLAHGSKVAEITFAYGTGEDAGRLVLKSIKPRNMGKFDYVLGSDNELIGIAPRGLMSVAKIEELRKNVPDGAVNVLSGMIPRQKVLHFVNQPQDGSVTGSSVLNAAYLPWFMKTQVIPEFFKFCKQFASPTVVGKLPKPSDDPSSLNPTPEEITRPDGSKALVGKLEALLNSLLAFRNAAAIALKGGTEIDLMTSEGTGEAYQFAMKYFGDQITVAILGTAQVTKEAKHESRGQNTVAQDVFGLRTMLDREQLAGMYTWLARELVRLNFGDAALQHAPVVTLSKIETADRFEAIKTYSSAYAQGFIQDDQLDDIYDEVGLPSMPEGWLAEKRLVEQQAAQEAKKISTPNVAQ